MPKRSDTSHLPPEVAIRLKLHMADRALIRVMPVDGKTDLYAMTTDENGPGQHERFAKAMRVAERAFPDGVILDYEHPVDDEDNTWNISFKFSRQPQEAAWDQRLFNAGHTLFMVIDAKQSGKLERAKKFLVQQMDVAARTLKDAVFVTGDPSLGVARNLLLNLYGETPEGRRGGPLGVPDARAETPEGVRAIARKAAAAMKEMLDVGVTLEAQAPVMPRDEEGRREYRALWWARTACLTALALKEENQLFEAPDDIVRDLINSRRFIGVLAENSGNEALDEGYAALGRLIAETPTGVRWTEDTGEVFEPIDIPEAQTRMLSAASELLDIIHERFPIPEAAAANGRAP